MSRFKTMCISLLALLQLAGCKISGDPQPERNFYSFDQTVKMTNVKKEYVADDIIWLEITVPNKQMVDLTTGQTIEVGNARFVPPLDVFDAFVEASSVDKFALIPQSGEVVEDANFADEGSALLAYGCPEPTYLLKVGIQFKKAGGYFLTFHKLEPVLQFFFTGNSDCSVQDIFPPPPEASIGSVTYKFDAADTNRDKFDEYAALFPDFPGNLETMRAAVDNKTAFFVRVVE
ncbi:MAG: hypothetical protein ACE5FF_03685 [Saprospiraceae bacterium]